MLNVATGFANNVLAWDDPPACRWCSEALVTRTGGARRACGGHCSSWNADPRLD